MLYATFFLLMRWMHLASAAVIIGGITLIVLSADPLRLLERSEAIDSTIKRIEKRYRMLMMIAVLALLVSGVGQWIIFGQIYQAHTPILVVLSFKVLTATTLFALLFGLHVETMSGEDAKAWRWINLSLAVTVLMLAGIVRYMRLQVMGG